MKFYDYSIMGALIGISVSYFLLKEVRAVEVTVVSIALCRILYLSANGKRN